MTWFRDFWSDDGGQGITEYACILAFVALLIVMVFSVGSGTFSSAIFESFSSMVGQLDRLTGAASSGT